MGDAENHVCRRAAKKAYDEAGIDPRMFLFAELHDASAFAEVVQVENLGFCEIGQEDGLRARRNGARRRIPVNPSGGLDPKATRSVLRARPSL